MAYAQQDSQRQFEEMIVAQKLLEDQIKLDRENFVKR